MSDDLPSSPPDSPGRYRQIWTCIKQRQEELENKQRELEEWDFELQEKERQHRESRLFLARKMSELEARELRAAKEEERRLSRYSALSGSPAPSADKMTPPSSSKKMRTPQSPGTPLGDSKLSDDLEDRSTQTDTSMYQENSPSKRLNSCKQLCRFGVVLSLAVKVCVLIAAVAFPQLSSAPMQKLTAWLPAPVSGSADPSIHNCSGVLSETRWALTQLQGKHDELEQMLLAGQEPSKGSDTDPAASVVPATDQLPVEWTWLSLWSWLIGA